MIVVDTNVVSELMRPNPNRGVLAWMDNQPDARITAVTAGELLHGAIRLPTGKRRRELIEAVGALIDIDFADRVLPFDLAASVEYARCVAVRERGGQPISTADALIAATAIAHGATALATRNVSDFADLDLRIINPWS